MGKEVEAVRALLEASTEALRDAEDCFEKRRYGGTVRESIVSIENAANAIIVALGGAYVSSHYELREALETVATEKWRELLRKPTFRAMLDIAEIPRLSVPCRYPVKLVEGKLQVRGSFTEMEAKKFLNSASRLLRWALRYIKEYSEKR